MVGRSMEGFSVMPMIRDSKMKVKKRKPGRLAGLGV
jgi:hypothetical protein